MLEDNKSLFVVKQVRIGSQNYNSMGTTGKVICVNKVCHRTGASKVRKVQIVCSFLIHVEQNF